MALSEITFAKGGITVTVYAQEINDNFANNLFIIAPAQTKNNQPDGSKAPKVVDLLRVTHQIIIKGELTGTASKTGVQVKQDLVNIWKGAGAEGGTVTFTYDSNASAVGDTSATVTTTIEGFIEKVNFKEIATDEPSDVVSAKEDYTDMAKFEVAITFIEGTGI